jgi:hypothetical protein
MIGTEKEVISDISINTTAGNPKTTKKILLASLLICNLNA